MTDDYQGVWDEPADGGRPNEYRIDVSNDGMTWRLLKDNHPAEDRKIDDDGLLANTTRHYRVFARNDSGISRVAAGDRNH